MDKTLDDIIRSNPKRRTSGARRGGARTQILGNGPVNPSARTRYATTVPAANGVKTAAVSAQPHSADKIIVSNLPVDVNEAQVKELFSTTVGALKDVSITYDSAGRSKGVASVHFMRKGDGTKAYQQYNNRLIDGKKPMKIEIVVAPAPISLASRVAPLAVEAAPAATGARNGTAGRGRRGGGAGRGKGRKNERPPKSAADLDAEMEDYTASNATAAPTA